MPAAIKNVKSATGENFLKFTRIIRTADSLQKNLQPGLPFVRVMKNNQYLVGKYSLQGPVSIEGRDIIRMDSGRETIAIHAQLPKEMGLLKMKHDNGSLTWEDMKDPTGAQTFFRLLVDNKLFLGYLWQSALTPLSFAGPGQFVLKQVALQKLPAEPSTVQVEAQLSTDKGTIKIIPGVLTSFRKSGMSYQLYIQTSIYQFPPIGHDGSKGYVFHALVARVQ